MGYTAVTCPQCGAVVESIPGKGSFYCMYCGSKIEKEKQYVEVSGNVVVGGMASQQSLLDRAYLFLEDRDFENADKYFERVLDINPKCSKAYLGKILAKKGYRNAEEFVSRYGYQLEKLDLFQKALRFATDEEYDELIALKNENIKNHTKAIDTFQKLIDRAERNLKDFKVYYQQNKITEFKHFKKIFPIMLLFITAIIVFAFTFTFIFIGGPFFLLFAVPSGVASALCITWGANENKKRLNTNETLDKNLEQLENEVKQRHRYLDSCIRNWNGKDPNE